MFKAFGLETSFNLAGNKKSKRDFISDKVLSGPGISKKEIDQAVALFDIIILEQLNRLRYYSVG
jgi:hypothetical protein